MIWLTDKIMHIFQMYKIYLTKTPNSNYSKPMLNTISYLDWSFPYSPVLSSHSHPYYYFSRSNIFKRVNKCCMPPCRMDLHVYAVLKYGYSLSMKDIFCQLILEAMVWDFIDVDPTWYQFQYWSVSLQS